MGKEEKGKVVVPEMAYPESHEMATANYLASLGRDVVFIVPVRTKGVRTPDIFMDGVYWEMKSPIKSGRWVIETILKKAIQKSDSVILDTCRTGMIYEDICVIAERQFFKLKRMRRLLIVDSNRRRDPVVFRKR